MSSSYKYLSQSLVPLEMSQNPNRFPSYPNQTGYPQGGMMPNQMGMNQGMMNAYEKIRKNFEPFWTISNYFASLENTEIRAFKRKPTNERANESELQPRLQPSNEPGST